jgi:hypothetical protein
MRCIFGSAPGELGFSTVALGGHVGGKNNTLDNIFDELGFRGITRDEYASILHELVERGWVQQDGETYQPTVEGKRLRDDAEVLTDTYFSRRGIA